MNAEHAACLTDLHGNAVPLSGVSAKGQLQGLLLDLTVEQHYCNSTGSPIESVYTFPLPTGAVLLGFELDLNGQRHVAKAVERRTAEMTYEAAIDDGNSAALLTLNDDGLYTANLANLLPRETATIRYRYAEFLSAHRGVGQIRIPTVIAPRYGNPANAGLTGAAIPATDLVVEYPFSIELDLIGVTDAAKVRSPSHRLDVTSQPAGLKVRLRGHSFLDRDLVLQIDGLDVAPEALATRDGDETVVMATAILKAPDEPARPLALKLLVDCSGSMQGANIAAARRAVIDLLDRLDGRDRLSLTVFGSRHRDITEGMEPADAETLAPLRLLVRGIDADLGGTEMDSALAHVLQIPVGRGMSPDVLLITDGAVHEVQAIAATARNAGHRLFAVMIGAAPNEALARLLSDTTGGACDFVADDEDAAAAITRMLFRMRGAARQIAKVEWPARTLWTSPLPTAVFADEPIRLFAGFAKRPEGPVRFTVRDAEDRNTLLTLPLGEASVASDLLPRMAAAHRLKALPEAQATALAVRHQLASSTTSLVMVAERETEQKNSALPVVTPVKQMWVARCLSPPDSADSIHPSMPVCSEGIDYCMADFDPDDRIAFSRSEEAPQTDSRFWLTLGIASDALGHPDHAKFLASLITANTRGEPLPETIDALRAQHGMPEGYEEIIAGLCDLVPDGSIATAIRVLIAVLTRDTAVPMDEETRDRLAFDVYSDRRYRQARKALESLCLTAVL